MSVNSGILSIARIIITRLHVCDLNVETTRNNLNLTIFLRKEFFFVQSIMNSED